MGKIRTRLIGDTEVEEKQKKQARSRAVRKKNQEKKSEKEAQIETVDVQKETKASKTTVREPKKRGKKYLYAMKKIDSKKLYALKDAVKQLKSLTYASFDESIELHLNVLETGLRGEVTLPHGTGKSVKVAIVDDVVLAKIGKGVLDFDILISHPSFMNKLAKYAKVLGPKGLMPNPKAGTIGPEPEKLAEKFKKGTVRWKTEPKFPLIHQIVGKISLKPEQIAENTRSFIQSVGTKNITKAYIKLTMSPALQIDLQNI